MKKCIFRRNPKASYFKTEPLIVQKVALPHFVRDNGFRIYCQFGEKAATNWKKWKKIRIFIS